MLLLYLLLVHFTLGFPLLSEDLCYGVTYDLPSHFTPAMSKENITYTPKVGQSKIVVSNGQSLDPRFKVFRTKIQMTNLCERDNDATLSIDTTTSYMAYFNSVRLRVKNCRSISKKLCGSFIKWQIPFDAVYLEFSGPDVHARPEILWNRTNHSSFRGEVSGSNYEIKSLTKKDSGYYRFRGSKDELLKWDQIEVEEHVRDFTFDEGEIRIDYPIKFTPAQVKITPYMSGKTKKLYESDSKFTITNSYLAIVYAKPEDSGTYDFLDKDGNIILHVTLNVNEVERVWVSLVVLAAISCGFIMCCCFLTKYCCKESSNKTNSPESDAEDPTSVRHNGAQTQTEPVTPLLAPEPRVVLPEPPTYNETGGFTDPPPPYETCVTQPSAPPVPPYSSLSDNAPAESAANSTDRTDRDGVNDAVTVDVNPPDQVSAAGATTFSANVINFTTDPDPHFEMSGAAQPSSPPLISDGCDSVLFNSDNLSFFE